MSVSEYSRTVTVWTYYIEESNNDGRFLYFLNLYTPSGIPIHNLIPIALSHSVLINRKTKKDKVMQPLYSSDSNQKIQNMLDYFLRVYTDKHSKSLICRLDFRYPQGHPVKGNELSRCLAGLQYLLNDKKNFDFKYIWVREQRTSDNPHYHLCIFLNGHKAWSFHAELLAATEKYWARSLGIDSAAGLIHHCKPQNISSLHGRDIFLDRNDSRFSALLGETRSYLSYMSKNATKDLPGAYRNTYGCSQKLNICIPPNEEPQIVYG
jgi:hypothetical protein